MSTECQKVSQTDRKIYSYTVTERQNDSMTVWQNSRAAKEPALVMSGGEYPPPPGLIGLNVIENCEKLEKLTNQSTFK